MKRLIIVLLVAALALVTIGPASAIAAAGPEAVGRVVVDTGDTGFFGDLQLMSDGTVSGSWHWSVFWFCGLPVMFHCNRIDSLSFPDEHTAVFSGMFTCGDMCIYTGDPVWKCDLNFVLTDRDIGNETNPSGLPVAVPPGISLPFGYDTLQVYCFGGRLIATQHGDYKVTAH